MNNPLNHISDNAKGILLMVGGALLLFNTLGIMERGLNLLIIVGAITMIVVGGMLSKVYEKIHSVLKKK